MTIGRYFIRSVLAHAQITIRISGIVPAALEDDVVRRDLDVNGRAGVQVRGDVLGCDSLDI